MWGWDYKPQYGFEICASVYSIASLQVIGVEEEHIQFDPKVFALVDLTCFQMCEIHVKNTFPCSVHGIISFLVYYSH